MRACIFHQGGDRNSLIITYILHRGNGVPCSGSNMDFVTTYISKGEEFETAALSAQAFS